MSAPIRVGVVGTSWWADLMHLPSLTSHPGAVAAAVCGRDAARAGAVAAKFGVPAAYTSYEAMIDGAALDAVIVATPDDLHAAPAMRALARGLHVLCEKPLARTAAEALAMRDLAARAGVVNMVFFTYRWVPAYRFLRDLVAAGRIGRPLSFALAFVNGYGLRPGYAWRYDARRSAGVVSDLGAHMIDLVRWALDDEAVRVSASLSAFAAHAPPPHDEAGAMPPANDSALVALELAGGAHGTLYCSSVARLGDQGSSKRITLRGDRGTIEASITLSGAEVRLAGDDGRPAELLAVPPEYGEHPSGDTVALFREQPIGVRAFVDAIAAGTRPAPSFHDGWRVQQVIDAALRSAEGGRWEEVGE
jgi:predicted dehydrogenase